MSSPVILGMLCGGGVGESMRVNKVAAVVWVGVGASCTPVLRQEA